MHTEDVAKLAEKLGKVQVKLSFGGLVGGSGDLGTFADKDALEALARVALEDGEEQKETKATKLVEAIFKKQQEAYPRDFWPWGVYIGLVTPGRLVIKRSESDAGNYATGGTVEGALERYLDCCIEPEEPK